MLTLPEIHIGKKDFLLYVVLFCSLAIRLYHLDYNTPFNDEAIYVVIGNMGIIENDFYTYNAAAWMGGLPVIYPVFTSLAYQTGGIIASRFLNVIFGLLLIEEIFILTRQLKLFDEDTNLYAAFFAALVAGMAGVGIYTSRLATYDIPSFFFLFFGINELIKAVSSDNGKYYFLAAVGLLLAYFTKIVVAIYYPVIVIFSLYYMKKFRKDQLGYWFKYFLVPLIIGFIIYLIISWKNLISFFNNQVNPDFASYSILLNVIREDLWILAILVIIAVFVLVKKGKNKQTLILCSLALILPAVHLLLHRYTTLDKHLYLTVLFFAPVVGYGLSYVVNHWPKVTFLLKGGVVLSLLLFAADSSYVFYRLEQNWPNTQKVDDFLYNNVKPDDKVLTESGASTVLALYTKTYPTNITTFDWIDYSGYQDERGYNQAVKDKYFKYIELSEASSPNKSLEDVISAGIADNYKLVYAEDMFKIYERNE